VTRVLLAAALLALAATARAEPQQGGVESLIRWEWRIRWLQDVPELELLIRNQTEGTVWYGFQSAPGEAACGRVRVGGEVAARSWSHRAVTLLEARGKLPCDLGLTVLADAGAPLKPPSVRTAQATLTIAARTQEPPAVPVAPADVALRTVVEDGCAPGAVNVRLLVDNLSASPTRVRAAGWGARCSDGTPVAWEGVDRAALDLPARGWAVLVGAVRAPQTSLLRACRGWIEVETADEKSPVPLGRVEFSLAPAPSWCGQ
jgi:hypothetical protein